MKTIYSSKLSRKGRLITLVVGIFVMVIIGFAATGCKAWRTITTSATYVQQNDSANAKTTTTISTKTVEEYQGVKKK